MRPPPPPPLCVCVCVCVCVPLLAEWTTLRLHGKSGRPLQIGAKLSLARREEESSDVLPQYL